MKKIQRILPLLVGIGFAHSAMAQGFQFTEVKTNLTQATNFAPTTITDAGDVFIVIYSNGPAGYFLHNGTLVPVAYQANDVLNYANTLETVVGFSGLSGIGFVQDKAGNRTNLAAPSGGGLNATGINRQGVVVGQDNFTGLCYLYKNGTYTLFQNAGTPSYILNINDLGDACGGNQIYLRNGNVVTINAPAGSLYTTAYAINNYKLAVGNYTLNSTNLGFVADPYGRFTTIDGSQFGPPAYPGAKAPLLLSLSRSATYVWGLNNLGQIAGIAYLGYSDLQHTAVLDYGFVGSPACSP